MQTAISATLVTTKVEAVAPSRVDSLSRTVLDVSVAPEGVKIKSGK
jgi:hypothetical protein